MGSPASALPLTRSSVFAAHELIEPHIHLTPVLTSTTLSTLASTPQSPEALKGTEYEGQEPAKPKMRLFFKCENYQKVGAFKARGAFHAIARLSDEQLQKGVVTHSSGMCASVPFLYPFSLSRTPFCRTRYRKLAGVDPRHSSTQPSPTSTTHTPQH